MRQSAPPHTYSAFHPLAYWLSLLVPNDRNLGWIASVILSICVALKGALSFRVLAENVERLALPALVAVALAFVTPIMNWWNHTNVLVGQIPPNVWHNATTIVAMPFAILGFYAGLRSSENPSARNTAVTSTMLVLGAAAKPSFVIAFLPALLPWFCWSAYFRHAVPARRIAMHLAALILPLACLLLVQAFMIVETARSRVIVAPLAVWSMHSPYPLVSSLLSLAFPLAVVALYRDRLRGRADVALAWATLAVAVLYFAVLAEDGRQMFAGNFGWGTVMAAYLVFLVCANVFFREPLSARSLPALALFALHLGSGFYLYWRVVTGLPYF